MSFSQSKKRKIVALEKVSNVLEVGLWVLFYKKHTNMKKQENIRYLENGKRTFLDMIEKCDTATGKTAVKKAQEFVHGILEEKCEKVR